VPKSSQQGRFPRKERALRFRDDRALLVALNVLEKLEEDIPLEYDLVPGHPIVVVPNWAFPKVESRIAKSHLTFEEVEVVPLSSLPPEEQAKRRGFLRSKPTQ
jgi:hypothetical protein